MRFLCFLCICSCLFNIPQIHFSSDGTNPETIRLASYNVKFLFDDLDDPYTLDQYRSAKSDTALHAIAQIIHEVNPDLLVLQEIEHHAFLEHYVETYLYDLQYETTVVLPGNDRYGLQVGLISKLPIRSATSHRYERFYDSLGIRRQFARDFLWVELELGNIPCFIGVVHFKSPVGDPQQTEAWRIAEAETVQRIIRRHLMRMAIHPTDIWWAILGDLNDSPASPVLQTFTDPSQEEPAFSLQDVHASLHPRPMTFFNSRLEAISDYMLLSKAMATQYIPESARVYPATETARIASDHQLIWADFRIPPITHP
jgi:endonuclease/exonuclease/phosphatase family metal-dependent hydrolase